MPADFIIPSSSSDWPKQLWKLRLRLYVSRLCQGIFASIINEEEWKELKRMGIFNDEIEKASYIFYNKVLPSLKLHRELHGHMLIPATLLCPTNIFVRVVNLLYGLLRLKDFHLEDGLKKLEVI